jgi:putative component of membrane protein insertase Oxa1/YidC/SpoIIIJ protein YidD
MTATLPLSPLAPLACWLIELYQRYLSPRKGFCCAYRVRHRRRDSCSQYAKRAISKLGLLPGVRLLRRRFGKCRDASRVLDYEPKDRKKQRRPDRSSSYADWGSACNPGVPCDGGDVCSGISAAGDVASGCVDGASCDVGGCDLSI